VVIGGRFKLTASAAARGTALSGIALLGAALLVAPIAGGWWPDLTVRAIEETIQSWGAWGVVGSIGLMIAHSFVPFPAELVAFANGMVYGPLWGTVITWVGAMLGAFLAFGLARKLGRPLVEAIVARKNWDALDSQATAQSGRLVFISRFIPVIAFNLVNYAAGLTRMSWWTFGWATGVGILPVTTLVVVMGDRVESLSWKAWLLLFGGGLFALLLFRQGGRWLRGRVGGTTARPRNER